MVVTYGGGHAGMVAPVVRELAGRAGWEVIVLGATTAGPQLRAQGIPAVGYRDLLTPGDAAATLHGRRLLAGSHDPATGIPEEESIAYLGLCYQDLVERLGQEEAAARYARHQRHAFLPLGPMRRGLDRWSPDVVIATSSPKSERAALTVAAERGIATLAIDDVIGSRQRFFPEFVPTLRADRICECTSIATELLTAQGVDPSSVRLTGNPAFDGLADLDVTRRLPARRSLGLDAADGAVLIATQAYTRLDRVVDIARDLRAIPRARLLLRRHPLHRRAQGFRIPDELAGDVTVVDDAPFHDVLAAADVLLTVSSTTAIEAVLVGRPVIQLGPGVGVADPQLEHVDDMPLYPSGSAALATSVAHLVRLVSDVLHGELGTSLRARASSLFVPPGGAALRVTDEVVALVGPPVAHSIRSSPTLSG